MKSNRNERKEERTTEVLFTVYLSVSETLAPRGGGEAVERLRCILEGMVRLLKLPLAKDLLSANRQAIRRH
jgi:hypothetical protein